MPPSLRRRRSGTAAPMPIETTDVELYNSASHTAFPSLVRTAQGTWRAYFREATAHQSGDGTVKQFSSPDFVAWTAGANLESSGVTYLSTEVGGAFLLASGNLIRFYTHSPDNAPGDNSAATFFGRCKISTDHGVTWGSEITMSILSSWWKPTGIPLVLADASILAPGFGKNTGQPYRSHLARSTDGGATWSSYATVAYDPARQYNEMSMVRLGSGVLMAIVRDEQSGVRATWRTTSSDNGLTWATPTLLPIEIQIPSMVRLSGGRIYMFCRDRPAGASTSDTAYFLSDDDGVTWSGPNLIRDGGASTDNAYTSPVVYNGAIYMVYYTSDATGTSIRVRKMAAL